MASYIFCFDDETVSKMALKTMSWKENRGQRREQRREQWWRSGRKEGAGPPYQPCRLVAVFLLHIEKNHAILSFYRAIWCTGYALCYYLVCHDCSLKHTLLQALMGKTVNTKVDPIVRNIPIPTNLGTLQIPDVTHTGIWTQLPSSELPFFLFIFQSNPTQTRSTSLGSM